ncbi:NAD(P)H-hydrate dehydratase [Exiguobacterium sp. SH3S1]|uniref:NAD(P)H-hydrate dehydratase n=1 Tax=Exiguobacterium sp. SH3S1 TaxID=2510955 RepID=UPI00103B5C51|nr:NAD(P)H-hydrate dehydratase [Exiguobacterium sp. SH3S1]TCI59020.1 NAD(P)H-hydrate dehydratase [Exiguobacterium sp. SH3S1]
MIYTASDIKRADEQAFAHGTTPEALMERAALALTNRLAIRAEASVLVVCGRGNNGGDGWVIARELHRRGYDVSVWAPLGEPKSPEALTHAALAKQVVPVVDNPRQADYIIDALFGVGLDGPVTGKARDVITWMCDQAATVIAVDVPSGVPSDETSRFDGHAIKADQTLTLHGYKRSAFLNQTAPFYGKVERIDIGLPETSNWRVLTEADFDRGLLSRDPYGHKSTYGHGQLVGGSRHLIGAPFLAAQAALRSGLGLLDLAVPAEAMALAATLPEAMFYEIDAIPDARYAATAIGPGMVEDERLTNAWQAVKKRTTPIIVDAGALTKEHLQASGPLTLTPHPGELARLTGQTVEMIEADRFKAASDFARQHGVHLILKGTYTLIVSPDGTGAVNTVAAPALSKGGSGDVLTGMLLALWARSARIEPEQPPNEQAVLWHALAARSASERIHPASVLASDVIEAIGRV